MPASIGDQELSVSYHLFRVLLFITLLGLALTFTFGVSIATAETNGDRTAPDEASPGDTIEITTEINYASPETFELEEKLSDGVADTTVIDSDGGIVQTASSDQIQVTYAGQETAELVYEFTIADDHGSTDSTDPITIESSSHPDTIETDSIIITQDSGLTVSVPPGSEFSNVADGVGTGTPPRVLVPDEINIHTTISNPADNASSDSVGLAIFNQDDISPDNPPAVHDGETSAALEATTAEVSLAPDETTEVATGVEFTESHTGEYVIVATTDSSTSTTQLTAAKTLGFEDVEQWEKAYDRELEWVPPQLPPTLPLEIDEYYEMWNGIPTRPGTVEEVMQNATEEEALVRAAAFHDFYNPGPTLRPTIWNEYTHTAYVESANTISNHPTTAKTKNSQQNLGEGRSIIKDAYIQIASISPSTYWHSKPNNEPTHLVRNNASLLTGADYRVNEPGSSEFRSDHSRSSSALDVRFNPGSASYNMDPISIKANGSDVTDETVAERGGSEITYGTLANHSRDEPTDPINLSISTTYSYSKDVDVDELICVERDNGSCVDTEWQDAGTLNYRDEVTVENNSHVSLLSAHPDRREITAALIEEEHESTNARGVNQEPRTQYEIEPGTFWAGVEILTDETADSTLVKGSHYFYTKRNKDWDRHVQETPTERAEYTSAFTPVELHAYPIEDTPHIHLGKGELIDTQTATSQDAPRPPSGINASTQQFLNIGESVFSPATPYEPTTRVVVEKDTNVIRSVEYVPAVPTLDREAVVNTTSIIQSPELDVEITDHDNSNNQTIHLRLTNPETGAPLSDRTIRIGDTGKTVQTDDNGEATTTLLPSEQAILTAVAFDSSGTNHHAANTNTYASTTVVVQTTNIADLSAIKFAAEVVSFIYSIFPWLVLILIAILTAKGISGAKY